MRSLPTPNLPRFYNSASCFGERGTAARGCWPAASPRASAFPCVSGPCVGVPLGPGGGAWDSTQHITTSFCPSAPLQPEPKEERHKAAAGGEPFLRGTLPHPDVMLSLQDPPAGLPGAPWYSSPTCAPQQPTSSPRGGPQSPFCCGRRPFFAWSSAPAGCRMIAAFPFPPSLCE